MKRKLFLMALLTLCIAIVQPAIAQGDQAKVTLTSKGETLPAVFAKIEKATSYKFNFAYDDVASYKFTGSITGKTVTEALNTVLSGKPFTYTVKGKIITITKETNQQKRIEIGGIVTNADDNTPVIGAQVKILGTQIATVTDINGTFRFNYTFSPDTEVEISYIGMKTVQMKGNDNMIISMQEDAKALENVVVTGIFRKAKESYTGAVTTIGSEKLEMFRGSNLLQTLKNADVSLNFAIDNINGSDPNNQIGRAHV